MVVSIRSTDFVLGLPPRSGSQKHSKWTWNMIHLMPCRNPCRLHVHLAFTYSSGPSSVVWSELGPAPPFQPMRVLEVEWSQALRLLCAVAFATVIGKIFAHNWLRSQCLQVQPVTYWQPPAFFIKLGHILYVPLKWSVISLRSWTSTGYFWNSTGSFVTNCWFSVIRALQTTF